MSGLRRAALVVFLLVVFGLFATPAPLVGEASKDAQQKLVQAQIVLTVSEGKRLIARAVAQMPVVKEALKNGMVIIAKGTTNTYVAEEILARKIPHGAYVLGRTYPEKGGKRLKDVDRMNDIILVNGKLREDLSLDEAVKQLKGGDVVIKGANALDYPNRIAAVITGSSDAGTTGKILPYIGARKAHLVVPVGLEKQVVGSALEIVRKVREPIETLNEVYPMFLLDGQIVTELEALDLLACVSVFQAAAGGIGGAEGAVRLVCRGAREQVQNALKLTEQIQGEPPFVE
ncbi:MAG TPA: hypothetical protein VMX13_15415 [Sedimentisphaerales bacterium]|nr:hypothetical protein [Sedimentisphaerales bacterium]